MVAEKADQEQQGNEDARQRSTIQFPYNDLEDAEKIASALHQIGGTGTNDQIAGKLGVSPNTGAFRYRLQVARMFGLIRYERGTATLTPLGQRICDPRAEKAARAEAFATVPLYKRVLEEFKGTVLPPNDGFESALIRMGVAKKVADKARQVLQRSAQQAGYFWGGHDRLIQPAGTGTPSPDPKKKDEEKEQEEELKHKHRKGGGDGGDYHPFIEGLLKTLPPAETEWKIDDRRKWLQAAANIFCLIYTAPGGENTELTITAAKSGANSV